MHQNYYVYTHKRIDTGEIFYVGMGKTPNPKKVYKFNTKYSRAFEKVKRSSFWKNITDKTDYEIEIVFESNIKEEAQKKEIELIEFYGRRWLNNGTLVNFQSGGDYNDGPKPRGIRITQLDKITNRIIKVWEDLILIEKELGFLRTNIVKCCRKKQITAYNFKWEYTDNRNFDSIRPSSARKKNSNRGIGIEIYDKLNNKLLKICLSQKEAAEYLKLHISTIHRYLMNKSENKYFYVKYSNW